MNKETYNKAIAISNRLSQLKEVKKELEDTRSHYLTYAEKAGSLGDRDSLCCCDIMEHISTILDKHDKMILSFKLILNTSEPDFGEHKCHIERVSDNISKLVEDSDSTFDSEAYIKWHDDKQKTIEEGLKLFAEYFQSLWI